MPLTVTMLKSPETVTMADAPRIIGEQGGSLGRGPDNTWVLEDPDSYVSSLHCRFSFESGQYYLIDLSMNGTFFGDSPSPMGNGAKLPVNNNDRFAIGDYEFQITFDRQPGNLADPFADTDAMSDFKSAAKRGLEGFAPSPFEGGHTSGNERLVVPESEQQDPIKALEEAYGVKGSPNERDNLPGELSENWWNDRESPNNADGLSSGLPEPGNRGPAPDEPKLGDRRASLEIDFELKKRQQELEKMNARLQAEIDQLKQQLEGQDRAPGKNQVDTIFVEALGLGQHNLGDQEIMRINRIGGEILREMIFGLMQVLRSRISIKKEFRMNVTTLQPKENNPLKFSPNEGDALENMFIKKGDSFKQPIESVRDGFDDVANHQLAILAGMREAFRTLIDRFDPVRLEEGFSKQHRSGLLPGNQKAKNWDSYTGYYENIRNDIDKSFQKLFGDGFVRAYEDQLQKLAIARKAKKYDNDN